MSRSRHAIASQCTVRGGRRNPSRHLGPGPAPSAGVSMVGGQDSTRPLMLGYLRRELFVTEEQVDNARDLMAEFAVAEGFSMGAVYVERSGLWPAEFEALLEAVNRYKASAVVLPSLLHFAVLDPPKDIKGLFERATSAQVMVAQPH